MSGKSVLIIGGGIGGLATALRLTKRGYQVTIVEKNTQMGGRLNQIEKDGFKFDTGPSFFSMSYEFQELARDCQISLPFSYTPLEILYTVYLSFHSKLFFIYKDIERLSEQFKLYEPDFYNKMKKYLKKCGALYRDTVEKIVKRNFNSVLEYLFAMMKVNPVHLPVLLRNFWQQVSLYFDSEEAREIISLVAFFLGRTPFDTNGVYTLLSYVEFEHDGYYNVKGGMYRIVEGFVHELKKAGVKLFPNVEIEAYEIQEDSKLVFIDQNNNRWSADLYVVNADAALFRSRVLKNPAFSEKRLQKMEWTMGYLTVYLGIDCKLPTVEHHNYYLGKKYRYYTTKVLQDPNVLEEPYYYVNVVSKFNPECAPKGCESLFFVCPVPNLLVKPQWEDRDQIVERLINDFSLRVGINIRPHIVTKKIYTPIEWERMFNLYKGSGLGLSHRIDQIGAFRPANHDEHFKNVFYVGASTVPGAGIPMSIISSRLVVERIEKFLERSDLRI